MKKYTYYRKTPTANIGVRWSDPNGKIKNPTRSFGIKDEAKAYDLINQLNYMDSKYNKSDWKNPIFQGTNKIVFEIFFGEEIWWEDSEFTNGDDDPEDKTIADYQFQSNILTDNNNALKVLLKEKDDIIAELMQFKDIVERMRRTKEGQEELEQAQNEKIVPVANSLIIEEYKLNRAEFKNEGHLVGLAEQYLTWLTDNNYNIKFTSKQIVAKFLDYSTDFAMENNGGKTKAQALKVKKVKRHKHLHLWNQKWNGKKMSLSIFYRFLLQNYSIPHQILETKGTILKNKPTRDSEILRIEQEDIPEVLRLIEERNYKGHGLYWKTFVGLLIYSGLRQGEARTLDISDIVWKTDPETGEKYRVINVDIKDEKDLKTANSKRDVFIMPELAVLLDEYLASDYCDNESGVLFDPDKVIKTVSDDKYWVAGSLSIKLNVHIFPKDKFPQLDCLVCRHTIASILLRQGYSYAKLAAFLGNTPKVCEKHYAKWSSSEIKPTLQYKK